MKNEYFVEMTDTFSGEANYSWVNRFMVTAKSPQGAMQKVSKETGYKTRKTLDSGDFQRYDAKGACVCFFVSDPDNCGLYKVKTL